MLVPLLVLVVPLPSCLPLGALLADVPGSSGGARRVNYSSAAGKHENLDGKASSARERTKMASGGVNNVGIIVGAGVSAASLLVIIVAVLLCRRRRRKRDDYALSVRCVLGGLGPTTVDDDLPNVVSAPRYQDRPLPDIVHQVRLTHALLSRDSITLLRCTFIIIKCTQIVQVILATRVARYFLETLFTVWARVRLTPITRSIKTGSGTQYN